jgi:hypothetical protein
MAGPYTGIIVGQPGDGVSRLNFGQAVKNAIDDIHARLSVEEAASVSLDGRLDALEPFADWAAYTLAWTSSGTAPALGNATVVSRHRQHKKMVTVNARVTFGGTSTFGTGGWAMSLPVNAAQVAIGSAYFRDVSAGASGHFPGICVVDPAINAGTVNFFNVASQVQPTVPFTWVSTDHLSFSITYEAV